MPNTYTQIHIQVIFAVRNRQALIRPEWEDDLFKYITGIIQSYDHKMLIINGTVDHIHLLIGFRPTQALSDLIRAVKSSSSKWINESKFVKSKFSWQEGFGAFSYSKSQLKNVIRYIENQKEHHKKQLFIDEYIEFLEAFEIKYNRKFIFKQLS